jgi:hypothetical protein
LHEGNTEEEKNGSTSSLTEISTGQLGIKVVIGGGVGDVTPFSLNPFYDRHASEAIFKRRRERISLHL